MIVAVKANVYNWVKKYKEFNGAQSYIGTTKAMVREAIEKEGDSIEDYVFFTDRTRPK